MILVTGGTGFIGQALIRHLLEAGHAVRILLRPSVRNPNLPRGVTVEVAVSSLRDRRGLRGAMVGVDTVYHLVGGEWRGTRADLLQIDIQGTQAVAEAAADAGVKRLLTVSHLGADRASAFPVLKAKAIAEEYIRQSGVPYTILRTAIAYGPNDSFTTGLALLLHALPFVFFTPGDGRTFLQPIWIEDLATCLTWAIDSEATRNETYEIGGPEFLTFKQVVTTVMESLDTRRWLVPLRPPYLRGLTVFLDQLLPSLPISVYWLDYLASNRTCSLDTVPRVFNLMPSRINQRLAYLKGYNWRRELIRAISKRTY